MAETKSERHDRLSREFLMMAGTETSSVAELLVVVESCILAAMHLMVKLYGMKPGNASIFLEAALHRATMRFSEPKNGG